MWVRRVDSFLGGVVSFEGRMMRFGGSGGESNDFVLSEQEFGLPGRGGPFVSFNLIMLFIFYLLARGSTPRGSRSNLFLSFAPILVSACALLTLLIPLLC